MLKAKFLLIFAVAFIPSLSSAQYSELYDPGVPKKITIKMDSSVAKSFELDLTAAHAVPSANIPDENKKRYSANFYFADGEIDKICGGKFRISGDWKDHIDASKKIASLDVSLSDKCYIGDIAKFKLFLPNTRGGNNEIFWSLLLNEYGFPALYTRIVDVDFNGVSYVALFQEKPSTAFLERHGIRESPILKHDERQIWETRKEWYKKEAVIDESKKTPDVFAPGGFVFDGIFYDGVDSEYSSLVNSEYLKSGLRYRIALNAMTSYRNKTIENDEFFNKINRTYAPHGLIDHNRRFIYNPITNTFIPLYYDGNVNTFEEATCDTGVNNETFQRFAKTFESRANAKLSEGMLCAYARIYDIQYLNKWSIDQIFKKSIPVEIKYMPVGNLASGIYGIKQSLVYSENYIPFVKESNSKNYKKLDLKQLKNYLIGNEFDVIDGYKISTVVAGERLPSVVTRGIEAPESGEMILNVPSGVKYYVYIPVGKNRRIAINLHGEGARVLLTGQTSETDTIFISGEAPNLFEKDRHDDQMITGCATFYKFKFNGGSIYSDSRGCEDSINILSSYGYIDHIEIQDSTADALDIDFSNIKIANVIINGAGNDCVDLSSGTYEFYLAKMSKCEDKGVSIGERSSSRLHDVRIHSAAIGVAVKDESELRLDSLLAENIKSSCVENYIKKNKFRRPSVLMPKITCGMQL